MAKDILITPASGKLEFSGSSEPLSSSFISDVSGSLTLYLEKTGNQSFGIEGSGSTLLKVDGTQGRLFSITDEMSGSIFSANTIAGLPVIEAFSDNKVTLGPYSSPVIIDSSGNISGSSTSTGSFGRLDIAGNIYPAASTYYAGGGTSRIFFNNLRAFEGNTDGSSLNIGEDFTDVRIRADIRPESNASHELGTATYKWSDVNSVAGTFTGTLTAASFVGPLTGNADTVTNGVYTTSTIAVAKGGTGATSNTGTAGANVLSVSPTLTGTPLSTTAAASTNNTQIATTAYADAAVAAIVDSAPDTLNTLNELAAALNDDATFSGSMATSIAAKLPKAGGTMSGPLAMGSNNITGVGTIGSGAITSTAGISGTTGTFGGTVSVPDGSASAPSITNTGDTHTGIFFLADNTIAFSTGGVQRGYFSGSGNIEWASGDLSIDNIVASGNVSVNGNFIGKSDNTTEIGTYSTGAIKRIRMAQGGELHFGDTTTSNFLGLTEGTVDQFADTDRLGLYYRNELKMYSNSNNLRFTMDVSGNLITAGGQTMFGTALVNHAKNLFGGSWTSGGAGTTADGLRATITTTGASGDTNRISQFTVNGSITTQAVAETVNIVSTAALYEPTITVGSGNTITNSATLYIAGAATEATNDYALWVDDGVSRFDGNATFAGSVGAGGGGGLTNASDWLICAKTDAGGTIDNSGGAGYFAFGDDYTTGGAILMVRHDGNRGTMGHANGSSLFKASFNDATALDIDKDGDATFAGDIRTIGTGVRTIRLESTTNAQNLNLDFFNNVNAIAGRITYQEGVGAFYFQPNQAGGGTALTLDWSNNATFGGTIGSGAITSTGLITGTDLEISGTTTTIGTVTSGIWNAGAVTSTGNVKAQASEALSYALFDSSNNNSSTFRMYNSAGTNTIDIKSHGGTATFDGTLTAAGLVSNSDYVGVTTASSRSKYRLYGTDTTYAIGMQSAITFGGLNDWAMTFQFNSESDRGFWWGDSTHTTAQGAMALTTEGYLNVARGVRIGYGESDTTSAGAGLQVSGAITSTGLITGTDLEISGTTTTIGTVTSGIWNAGAVTSTGGFSGTTGTFSGDVTTEGTLLYKSELLYSMGGTAGWSKVGTLSSFGQSGQTAVIEIAGHNGYNALDSQDYSIKLFIKTSNGSSTGPGGAKYNSWYERTGGTSSSITFKWDNSATDVYDLYMYIPTYSINSSYTIKRTTGTWTNSGTSGTDPGSNSATVLQANPMFNILDADVGIGTTSPERTLDVDGSFRAKNASGNLGVFTGAGASSFNITATAQITHTSTTGNTAFAINQSGAGDAISVDGDAFIVKADGKVGIGTTAPSQLLTVAGNISSSGDFKNVTNDGAVSSSAFYLMDSTYIGAPQRSFKIVNSNPYTMEISTNATTPVAVMNLYGASAGSAKVGINGTAGAEPSYTLDVNGTGRFTGDLRLDTKLLFGSYDIDLVSQTLTMNLQDDSIYTKIRGFDGTCQLLVGEDTVAVTGDLDGSRDVSVGRALDVLDSIIITNGSYGTPSVQFGSSNDGFYHGSSSTSQTDAGINVLVNNVQEFLFKDGGDFHADGDVVAYSSTVDSDKRLKTNIQPVSGSLDKVKKLRPVEFDWLVDRDRHEYGFIAQEVEEVLPMLVTEHNAIGDTKKFLEELDGTDKNKTVDYPKLTVLLVDAMKEQQKQIEELKIEIREIKNGST